MNKNLIALLLFVTSFGIAFGASAEEKGAYYGGGFSYSAGSGGNLTTTNGFGFSGRMGYDFNHSVAAEASIGFVGLGWTAGIQDVSALTTSVSVLGFYPVKDGTDVYAKLGYASSNLVYGCSGCTTASATKGAPTYGFGVEFGHGGETSFRLGVDHYDLSAFANNSLSANDFTASVSTRF